LNTFTRKTIKENIFWYSVQFLFSNILVFLYRIFNRENNIDYLNSKKLNKREIRTVLIIYSKSHFDPEKNNHDYENSQSSAGNIARNIYESFLENGTSVIPKIIYVDQEERVEIKENVDLIIGIVCPNFIWYSKYHKQARKILFLVNSHPIYRLKKLIQESLSYGKKISMMEYVSPYVFLKCRRFADQMIIIGNEFVKNTYIAYGVDEKSLILMNSGVNKDKLLPNPKERRESKLRIIYVSSYLALRKGLFRVIDIWQKLKDIGVDQSKIELLIMGRPEPMYKNDLENFVKKYSNVRFVGWIDSSHDEYIKVLQSSYVILFPSIEEGQVGTVLEAMSTGSVPIISQASGIQFEEKDGFIVEERNQIDEMARCIKMLVDDKTKLEACSQNARKYVEKNHDWKDFRNKIYKHSTLKYKTETVDNLDMVDIVITIFNQEKIVERQLYSIFKNTTTPFNLILVFDGCTDRTESRALKYIERNKPPLMRELRTKITPNVYEVKANNVGYKMVTSDYFINLQDDVLIKEKGWERRITYPLRKYDDVLGVTARIAEDFGELTPTYHKYINQKGKELGNLPRNIFAIRDRINRGPIAYKTEYIKKLNYYNEDYSPSDLDDADLCLRAWEDYKWKVGVFWIEYLSRIEWGKSRSKDSTMNAMGSLSRNQGRLLNDHRNYFNENFHHDEDRIIQENEIDYVENRTPALIIYPIRFDFYHFRRFLESKIPIIRPLLNKLNI
jgi:glycosyltransferase involved in cell wall biosynthesis